MIITRIKNAVSLDEINSTWGGDDVDFVNIYNGVITYIGGNITVKLCDDRISFESVMLLEVLLTAQCFELYVNGVLKYNHELTSETAEQCQPFTYNPFPYNTSQFNNG